MKNKMGQFVRGHKINLGKRFPNRKSPPPFTIEHRRKMSETQKKLGLKPPSFKGKTYQEIYGDKWEKEVEKRRLSRLRTWDKIGRKPKRPMHDRWEYNHWKSKIFIRDNWACQICGRIGGRLQAHHIKSWINYPELRYIIDNGITLCESCHKVIHKIYGKKKRNK